MARLGNRINLSLALLSASLVLVGGRPTWGEVPGLDGACDRAESERFVFHSEPWINLHHFLFEWARNIPERQPEDRRRGSEVPEAAELAGLDEESGQIWNEALDFYRKELIAKSLLFNEEMISLRGQLAEAGCSSDVPETLDPGLRSALTTAMPVYRQHWWSGHQAGNRSWTEDQLGRLETYESALAERLAQVYGGEWPDERIRVDVVAYANWAGAYTSNHPDHITISSLSDLEWDGLELLFHEVSHAAFFEQKILRQVSDAFEAHGVRPPNRLAHSIQFATPAELLRSLLAASGVDRERTVADAVYQRGSFRDQYQVVLEFWKPYLEGDLEGAVALEQIASRLSSRGKLPSL
jgi:hypothetical protein